MRILFVLSSFCIVISPVLPDRARSRGNSLSTWRVPSVVIFIDVCRLSAVNFRLYLRSVGSHILA